MGKIIRKNLAFGIVIMLIAVIFTAMPTNVSAEDGSSGIVAYWNFDEGSGNTAYDSSGNGYNGILRGSAGWTEGVVGSAVKCNGRGNNVDAPHIAFNDRSSTVMLWFKLDKSPAYTHLFNQRASLTQSKTLHYVVKQIDYRLRMGFYYNDLDGTTVIQSEKWYHVTFVYDLNLDRKYIYLDGELDNHGASAGPYKAASGVTWIGNCNGAIDEVRVFDYALSQAEVKSYYESDIKEIIQETSLNDGIKNSLLSKLDSYEKLWKKGQYKAAMNLLEAIKNEVDAKFFSGDLTNEEYTTIIDAVNLLSNFDEDNDGLPDVWEMENNLDPTNPSDSGQDPDNDGLNNEEEYKLRSDPDDHQDLFIEIDYMPGHRPNEDALDYFSTYYSSLPTDVGKGVEVHIIIDDEVPYEEYLEDISKQRYYNDNYHDNEETHVYVLYANRQSILDFITLGISNPIYGSIIFDGAIDIWALTNPILTMVNIEKTVLLHEIGHTIGVGLEDDWDLDEDGQIDEVFSGSINDFTPPPIRRFYSIPTTMWSAMAELNIFNCRNHPEYYINNIDGEWQTGNWAFPYNLVDKWSTDKYNI